MMGAAPKHKQQATSNNDNDMITTDNTTSLRFKTYAHPKWGTVRCAYPNHDNRASGDLWFNIDDLCNVTGRENFDEPTDVTCTINMPDGSSGEFLSGASLLRLFTPHLAQDSLDAWLKDVLTDLVLNCKPALADGETPERQPVHPSEIDFELLFAEFCRASNLDELVTKHGLSVSRNFDMMPDEMYPDLLAFIYMQISGPHGNSAPRWFTSKELEVEFALPSGVIVITDVANFDETLLAQDIYNYVNDKVFPFTAKRSVKLTIGCICRRMNP